jgi:CheY-like chemotaxis protein
MKKNILLVDDENVFHFINSKVISSTGIDCEIQTASNGQEALAIINKYLMASTPAPDYIFIGLKWMGLSLFVHLKEWSFITRKKRQS